MHFYIFNTDPSIFAFVDPAKPDTKVTWLQETIIGKDIIAHVSKIHPIKKVKLIYVMMAPPEAEVAKTPDRYFTLELTTNRSDKTYRYPIGYYDYFALDIDALMRDLKNKKLEYFGGEEYFSAKDLPNYFGYNYRPNLFLFVAQNLTTTSPKRSNIMAIRGRFFSLSQDYSVVSEHFIGLKIQLDYFVPFDDDELSDDWYVIFRFYVNDKCLTVRIDAETYQDFEDCKSLLDHIIMTLYVDYDYIHEVSLEERIQNGIKILESGFSITNFTWVVSVVEEMVVFDLKNNKKIKIYTIVSAKDKENMYMAVGEEDIRNFLKKFDNGNIWTFVKGKK